MKGIIVNEINLPVPGVKLAVQDALTHRNQAAISDSDGSFSISLSGEYSFLLSLSCLGYNDTTIVFRNGEDLSIRKNIVLHRSLTKLKEVTVRAPAQLIEFKGDQTTINVSKSINSIGNNAFELLQKAPGVRMNAQEELVIAGKNGLNLYIDGRSSNIRGQDVGSYLKTLQSSDIEAIEIITNPSAKYEATGNAGIINIRLKKDKALGSVFTAVLSATQSNYRPKFNPSLGYNYRNKHLNISSSYNLLAGDYRIFKYNYREQSDYNNTLIAYNQDFVGVSSRTQHNLRVNGDYYLNKTGIIGVMFSTNISKSLTDNNSLTAVLQEQRQPLYDLITIAHSDEQPRRFDFTAYYSNRDSKGNELSFSGSHRVFYAYTDNSQSNIYNYPAASQATSFNSYNNSIIRINSIQADYMSKMGSGTFSAGIKGGLTSSGNNLNYFDLSGSSGIDTIRSNKFNYKEYALAAYGEYTGSISTINYRLGLRMENVNTDGNLYSVNRQILQSSTLNNFNLFPNFNVSKKFGLQHTLTVIYNKRIDRPEYRILNPFVVVQDDLFYQKGNPFLRPQYTHEYKLTHVFAQKMVTSFSYSAIKNSFLSYRDTIGGTRSYETRVNLNYRRLLSLSISLQNEFIKGWKNNLSMNFYRERNQGLITAHLIDMSRNSMNLSVLNSFILSNKLTAELSGTYNSKFLDVPAVVRPQWFVDVGLQRKLSETCFIKLGVADVFNTYRFDFDRNFGGLAYRSGFKTETHQIKFALTWKFGNQNLKEVTSKDKGADEVNKRLK